MNRRRNPLNPTRGVRPHPLSLSIPVSTRCRWTRQGVPLITVPRPTRGVRRRDPVDLAMLGLQHGVASLMVFLWLCAIFL